MTADAVRTGRSKVLGPGFCEVASATHWGKRRASQEDAFELHEALGLMLVADGVGGRPAGDVASSLAVAEVVTFLTKPGTTWPFERDAIGGLLRAAIVAANERVYDTGQRYALFDGMATTLVAALAAVDGVWIAHVGDSRALRLRDDQLERLTVDHTVASDDRVRESLGADDLHKYGPGALTRGIGLHRTVDVEMRFEKARDGDVIVLATDGLTKVVGEAEIAGVLAEASGLSEAVTWLVDQANAYGGPDNITVVAGLWTENKG